MGDSGRPAVELSVESEPEQPIVVMAMAGSGDEARANAQQGALASIVVATPVNEHNSELALVPQSL